MLTTASRPLLRRLLASPARRLGLERLLRAGPYAVLSLTLLAMWGGVAWFAIAYPQQLLNDGNYTLVSNNSHPDVQAKAYDVHEKLATVYAQADIRAQLGSTELTGNIGVQAVHTDQLSSGFRIAGGPPAVLSAASLGAKYWDVMPSMNLSFRFPNDWVIRAGLAREVQRPRDVQRRHDDRHRHRDVQRDEEVQQQRRQRDHEHHDDQHHHAGGDQVGVLRDLGEHAGHPASLLRLAMR